ncbi:unnamed protein product [Strongylus vulgaris]|uniref:Uncharacterized protein n=1 Tax=Strongylus vulgaris TaxID=40348 RepID=A0A3P7L422_STRVU|nr:unnamed protein product [Strongylus vulgaris]
MDAQDQNHVLGLISAILATALYGSCYVPVRWFEAGDAFVGWPPIFPVAMLGGFFFALGNALTITIMDGIGNALTITIMDGIGMAVGSLLWNTVTCIVGWGVSRFGLFGSPKKVPLDNIMNIVGVIIVCVG